MGYGRIPFRGLICGLFALHVSSATLSAQPGPRGPGGPGGPGRGPGGPGGGGLSIGQINPASQAQSAINNQLQQLTRSFNVNDRNRDGRMNQPEFSQMFQSGAFSGIQSLGSVSIFQLFNNQILEGSLTNLRNTKLGTVRCAAFLRSTVSAARSPKAARNAFPTKLNSPIYPASPFSQQ